METAALYTLAAQFGVNALSVLTVSDDIITGEKATSEERENAFTDMIRLALELGLV
jgi:purine-nucleoside phosphorylase